MATEPYRYACRACGSTVLRRRVRAGGYRCSRCGEIHPTPDDRVDKKFEDVERDAPEVRTDGGEEIPAPFDDVPLLDEPTDVERELATVTYGDEAVPGEGPVPDPRARVTAPATADLPLWAVATAARKVAWGADRDDDAAYDALFDVVDLDVGFRGPDGGDAAAAVLDLARKFDDVDTGVAEAREDLREAVERHGADDGVPDGDADGVQHAGAGGGVQKGGDPGPDRGDEAGGFAPAADGDGFAAATVDVELAYHELLAARDALVEAAAYADDVGRPATAADYRETSSRLDDALEAFREGLR